MFDRINSSDKVPHILCTTIIPTVGRSSLTRAVESVLQQNIPNGGFEVIVVNDSGVPLSEADWQKSDRIQIITTNRRERSVARNVGASIAKGRYLHFLDDDDWLALDAYKYLAALSQSSNAKWLYGITQLVDRKDNPLIQLRHGLQGNCFMQVMAGEWIPLQSSWIERDTFMKIGGFNNLLSGPEDIELLRRILLDEELAEIQKLIAHVTMGEAGSTTDYVHHPEASRWARESILDAANAHQRMRMSAVNPFWRGRMLRVYLTSAVWNLKQKRIFAAAGRLFLFMLSALRSSSGLVTKDFWRAVSKPYASLTFETGFREIQKEKQR